MRLVVAILLLAFAAKAATLLEINPGTNPNDGTGDSVRTFAQKSKTNFAILSGEILSRTNGVATNLTADGVLLKNLGRTNAFTIILSDGKLTNAPIELVTVNGTLAVPSILTDGSDQTTNLDTLIDSLGSTGGRIAIPRSVRFSSKLLTVTNSVHLEYYSDSDTAANPGTQLISGERVNAYYGVNSGGIVNEGGVSMPFHPGWYVNVNPGDPSQNSVLGPGQTTNNPARAAFIIKDSWQDRFLLQYLNYPDTNGISGVQAYLFFDHYTFTGIGTGSFSSTPVVGELITGTTSKATGFVVSISSTNLIVNLISSGAGDGFAAGETVADSNETTSHTISSVTQTQRYGDGWFLDRDRGGQMVIGARKAPFPLTVAGALGVEGSIDFGQIRHGGQFWTNPTMVWGLNLNLTNRPKFWMTYDDASSPPIFRMTGQAGYAVGGSNSYANPQNWSQIFQVHSRTDSEAVQTNGVALSLFDHGASGDQWDMASYAGRLVFARGTNLTSINLFANGSFANSGGISVGLTNTEAGAGNLIVQNLTTLSALPVTNLLALDASNRITNVANLAGITYDPSTRTLTASSSGSIVPMEFFNSVAANWGDAATYYFGSWVGSTIGQAGPFTNASVRLPINGTLSKAWIRMRQTTSSDGGANMVVSLSVNDTINLPVLTNTLAGTVAENTQALSTAVTTNDYIAVKLETGTWPTTNPVGGFYLHLSISP